MRNMFFIYAWKQDKLDNRATFLTGNGLNWDNISENGEFECILYGHLYTDYGMIADKILYRTNTKLKNPFHSKSGDVLIPSSDTTPTGLARATSLEVSGAVIGGDINVLRPNKDINGGYLSLQLNLNKKKLLRLIKGSTVRHIHNSDIKNIHLYFPKELKEQNEISKLFKKVILNITFHQRT